MYYGARSELTSQAGAMHILTDLERRLRLRLVTSEFEVIAWLYANGSTPSRDLSRNTKASIANFQLIVRKLKQDGVLITRCGREDRRIREYDLSDTVRAEIDRALASGEGGTNWFVRFGLGAAD